MKLGDTVKVIAATYENFPIGYQGKIALIDTGWDDEGSFAVVVYLENDSMTAPFLVNELEIVQ